MTTDTIESLRQQLAECERERDEVKQVEFPRKVEAVAKGWRKKLATVTQQRDELVMILKWVNKYVSCAISQEIKAAIAKLGADETGEAVIDPNCTCDEHGACAYCWNGKKHDRYSDGMTAEDDKSFNRQWDVK